MNKNKLACYVATTLLSLMMLGGAGMYIFNHTEVAKVFEALGYPTYIIYPLAVAKVLGIIAIWSNFNKSLKEWAYAGFFYDLVLAVAAHVSIRDGEYAPGLVNFSKS
jgi:hypothetical protein